MASSIRATPAVRGAALRYSGALLLFALAAKTVLICRAAGLEPGLWQGAWSLPALYGEDVLLGVMAAALLGAVAFVAQGRSAAAVDRLAAVVYLLGALFMAVNVPITFVLGSPLTFSLLHATGAALSDSIRHYLTALNLSVLLGLLLAIGFLPRLTALLVAPLTRPVRAPAGLRGISSARRGQAVIGVVLAVVLAVLAVLLLAGPSAVARVETRGLARNAVLTFIGSVVRRADARLEVAARPPCAPFAARPSASPLDLESARAFPRPTPAGSIVWVILESTGARALSPYGGARETTPHLAALADHALIAARAYAAYPESIKGLFSMLCSRTPPPESEAAQYGEGRLPCASVASALAGAGYRTGLFHAGHFAYLGMDAVVSGRGFATLADAATIASPFKSSFGVDEVATVDALLRWVDAGQPRQPFFAVYMPIAGHHPYHAPGPAPRPFPERSAREEHRNDLHVVDQAVGRLRAGLATRGLDQDVTYVVVGDHGEAFEEHPGNIGHALHLYEENVRVPFFIAMPGRLPRSLIWSAPVSLLDLGPTTLWLAGLPVTDAGASEGQPLLAIAPAPRVIRFSTEQAQRQAGLIEGQRKLIVDRETGRARLFDLGNDPEERRDRAVRPTTEEARFIAHHRTCLAGDSI